MVMRVNITVSPVNLSDLYVINESVPSDRVQRLSDFQDSGSVLEGRVVGIDGTDVIRIISSGYVEQVTTLNALDQNPNIVLVSSNDAENLSDGTNTYPIADKTARELINSLDDCAFNGVYVDQTYDSTSTNAQSGTAVAEALAGFSGANTDLSNLTSTGKNIANWSRNVTNCITEIPQDIKLELNNGTLTLKAGSKVYVPNGFESDGTTPKFDVVTVSEDVSWISSTTSGTRLGLYTGGSITGIISQYIHSGNTSTMNSTTAYTYARFYNTETNRIYIGDSNGGNWVETNNSLPVCIFENNSSGLVTSIDHVFNGFGYIGSTVFALPGVKGLAPNGRNEDGTLKSTEITRSSVLTRTYTSGTLSDLRLNLQSNFIGNLSGGVYDEANNLLKNSLGQIQSGFVFATADLTNGVISNWRQQKTAFHVLDWNDSSTISGWGMPSSRYIDLTLGASGATYIAPANGYFQLAVLAGSSIQFYNQTRGNFWKASVSNGSEAFAETMECQKGDTVRCYYVYTTFRWFRFYYAEGEN